MKLLKFVAYLLYDYYSEGPRANIKYTATLGVMTLFIYINITIILLALGLAEKFFPSVSVSRGVNYLNTFLIMLPIYITLRILVKEKDLQNAEYDTDRIITGKRWLVVYFIISFVILVLLALWKKGKL